MFQRMFISFLFITLGTLFAQAQKMTEKQAKAIESACASYRDIVEKRFRTENIYASSSPRTVKLSLHHVSQTRPLLSDYLDTKYRVSEWALLKRTHSASVFSKWDVFVLTPQYEYKKVFEHVFSPFEVIDTAKGFYIFITDSIETWAKGQFSGTFWFVSRDGVAKKIRKLDNVIPSDRNYFLLLGKTSTLLYHLESDKQYVVPQNMDVCQCGAKGKILLKSRNKGEEFYIWSLETNKISPWHVDGRLRRFSNFMGGGWGVRADGTSMVYSPDFNTIYERVTIKEISFSCLSFSLFRPNCWALLGLENKMVLLDCATGKELLSAHKIEYQASCYFEIETETGIKKLIDVRKLKYNDLSQ